MTYDDVISYFGTQVKMGAALGISQSTISAWGRVVPERYQYQIEVITRGQLRADQTLRVPRNKLLSKQQAAD